MAQDKTLMIENLGEEINDVLKVDGQFEQLSQKFYKQESSMTSKLLKGKPDLNYSPMNLLPLISQCNCYINLDSSFTFLAILHSLSNSSP